MSRSFIIVIHVQSKSKFSLMMIVVGLQTTRGVRVSSKHYIVTWRHLRGRRRFHEPLKPSYRSENVDRLHKCDLRIRTVQNGGPRERNIETEMNG